MNWVRKSPKIFREYGEENLSREIAKAIVMTRLRPDGATARQRKVKQSVIW